MKFSKQFALSIAAALAFSCSAFGCDDEDGPAKDPAQDNPSSTCKAGKQGYSATCKCLEAETDWTKQGKSAIADYLISICKLSESFAKPEFQNAKVEDQGIGASCFCYGPKCNYAGYERPEYNGAEGTIYGCDNVAAGSADFTYNGAVRSCFRSTHIADIKPSIYFPGGTCALTMSKCTPSDECPKSDPNCDKEKVIQGNERTICGFAKFGDYDKLDAFTSCPDDEVLVDFVMNIEITSLEKKAKLDIRGCFKGCHSDADCHDVGTFDPITQEKSQFKCVQTNAAVAGDHKGKTAGVCFDKRSVEDTDSGIVLVNPGKYEWGKSS